MGGWDEMDRRLDGMRWIDGQMNGWLDRWDGWDEDEDGIG